MGVGGGGGGGSLKTNIEGGELGQFTDLSEGGGLCKKEWGGVFERGLIPHCPLWFPCSS